MWDYEAEAAEMTRQVRQATPDQVRRLAEAWRGIGDPEAWNAANYVATRAEISIDRWGAGCRPTEEGAHYSRVWANGHVDAWVLLRVASRALVVKDLISEENFNLLYGTWASVMGR